MGVLLSTIQQTFPPKPTFSVDDIPDLSGQVILITGATSGIGKETAKALLAHNAKVYIAARSAEKSQAAIRDLKAVTGKEAYFLQLDLADLKSIKTAVEEFLSKENQLHVLYNNGGVLKPPKALTTTEGVDLQFGTNVLGHFYLTTLLLPVMMSTAKQTGRPSRVITISSITALFTNAINYETLKDGPERRRKIGEYMYIQSKFANLMFAVELARRYGDQGIVSIAVNPGNIKTDLQRSWGLLEHIFVGPFLYPTPMGALTQLYGGTMPEADDFNGKFLVPWARVGKMLKPAADPAAGKKLWEWMETQVASN